MAKLINIEGIELTISKNEFHHRNYDGEFTVRDNLTEEELARWALEQRAKSYDPWDWDLTPLEVPGTSVSARLDTDEDGYEYITISHGFDCIIKPYGKEVISRTSAETTYITFEDTGYEESAN